MPTADPIPVPPPAAVFVERFPEPITGWDMVGAGAAWPGEPFSHPLVAEVRYDGVARVETPVEYDGSFRFGVQLPCEPGIQQVTVLLRADDREAVIFDGPLADLNQRGESVAPAKPMPRWLSPAATLGKSVASGECFSPTWWSARGRRYRELALKGRQKIRDKLLARRGFTARSVHDAYVERTTLSAADLQAMAEQAARFRFKPTISVLVPVYNVEPKYLRACIESVRNQSYPHWELCLADDASTDPATVAELNRLPCDPRIKLARRPANGHICAATNSAAELATGEFVALLDNDDVLAPHALFAVANRLQSHPDADLIYSDEDKLDAEDRRYDPQFKPDWSPELLLSYNYVNHFTVLRRSLFEAVGRFREGYEGSQDHDLLLRLTERTERVQHIPEVLYHWRSLPTSTASAAGVKRYVHTSGRRAVEDALARRKIAASLYVPPFAEKLNLPVLALDGPDDGPAVAVVVRGTPADAARTVRAVKQATAYRNHTVYLVVDDAGPADALNRIAAGRTEPFLAFLEAGVEPTDPRWLSRLVAHAQLSGVAAAGGLIRDADGAIASAGTVLGLTDGIAPGDAFRGQTPDPASYYFYAEVTRTVSAPGRGCLLVRRDAFERAGGFDAERFGRTLSDVDLCRRLAGLGLRSVHVGGAELRWANAPTRCDAPTELRAFGNQSDPYYNPNLSAWDAFIPRPDAPHLVPARVGESLPVLFATHNLTAFEGAPKIIQDVALGLTRRGTVSATAFAPAPGKAAAAYVAGGVPVCAEATAFGQRYVDGQWTPAEYDSAQRQATALIRKLQPRVVVANTLGMFPLVEAAARLGVPAVLAIQESYSEQHFARVFSPYGRWRCERSFLFADRVIFASRSCADLYRRLDGRKNFEVVHNGLVTAPFDDYRRKVSKADAAATLPGPAGDRLRVVAVGTVCERKAQHVLVEAAARLAKSRRDFVCYLVGAREGLPYLSYVRHLIRAHGLEDVVIPVPETDRVWAFLRAADAFVCASYVEAFSLSVLEAGAFGLPVVSTPCGGLDEQVAWGLSGLKFDFGDAAGLADRLGKLFADAAYRAEMGRQSRAAFDLRLTADGMLDRYRAVIVSAAGVRVAGRPAAAKAA